MLPYRKADLIPLQLKKHLQTNLLDTLAFQSEFIKRKPKKITPSNFLSAFLIMVLRGSYSFSSLAVTIGLMNNFCLSKQAVHKKISQSLVKFLKCTLEKILFNSIHMEKCIQTSLSTLFNRILIHDSTSIKLDPTLAPFFPGNRNQTGKTSSIMKIQAIYDLLTESFYHFDISGFTKNDQSASRDILDIVSKGDLIIRDLGYFVLPVLKELSNNCVFFLSRLKHGISIYENDGMTPINLLEKLKKQNILDIEVFIGAKEKVPVRLVATPVPEQVGAERRRKAKRDRDRRLNRSKEYLALLNWDIYVLNIDNEILDTEKIAKLYHLRWRIEIIFKSWKSHFYLSNVPKASLLRVMSYIYAVLIFITLFQINYSIVQNKYQKSEQLSLFKMAKFYKEHLCTIILFDLHPQIIEKQLLYHCKYESRKKRINYVQQVLALS